MSSNVRHLSTLSDHNYIINGLCLYDSLVRNSSQDFVLHYLCMDQYTYDKLNSLQCSNLKTYTLEDISDDPKFATLKENNACRPIDKHFGVQGSDQSDFHFALASFVSYFLLQTYNLPHVLYIDSDIIFYNDVETVFAAVGNKSIGLITHKHMKMDRTTRNPGYYNVGIVYFQNDEVGKNCLKFWRDCCIYPDNKYADIFGACGDQKYLELFGNLFGEENIEILCKEVGNGAPWNFTMFEFLEDNRIIWRDPEGNVLDPNEELEQDLVFNHFSHFTPNYDERFFRLDRGGEWGPQLLTHPGVVELYADYMRNLIFTKEKYEL